MFTRHTTFILPLPLRSLLTESSTGDFLIRYKQENGLCGNTKWGHCKFKCVDNFKTLHTDTKIQRELRNLITRLYKSYGVVNAGHFTQTASFTTLSSGTHSETPTKLVPFMLSRPASTRQSIQKLHMDIQSLLNVKKVFPQLMSHWLFL